MSNRFHGLPRRKGALTKKVCYLKIYTKVLPISSHRVQPFNKLCSKYYIITLQIKKLQFRFQDFSQERKPDIFSFKHFVPFA